MTTKDARIISDLAAKSQDNARQSIEQKDIVLPILAYHGTGRLWAEQKEKIEYTKQGSRLEGYINCLSSKLFKSWFKTFDTEAKNFQHPEVLQMLETFKKQ